MKIEACVLPQISPIEGYLTHLSVYAIKTTCYRTCLDGRRFCAFPFHTFLTSRPAPPADPPRPPDIHEFALSYVYSQCSRKCSALRRFSVSYMILFCPYIPSHEKCGSGIRGSALSCLPTIQRKTVPASLKTSHRALCCLWV